MKRFIKLLILFMCPVFMYGQNIQDDLINGVKKFYFYKGCNIDTSANNKIEIIVIKDLVEKTNSERVSLYYFASGLDSFFNILIVNNDSIDIYDIHDLNMILNKILLISKKDSLISSNMTLSWIKEVIYLNKLALDQSVFSSGEYIKKEGKAILHFSGSTIGDNI